MKILFNCCNGKRVNSIGHVRLNFCNLEHLLAILYSVWDEHGGYNFNKLHFCDENVDYLNLLHATREFIVIVSEIKLTLSNFRENTCM